jgi:hypothetical protein
MYRAVSLLDISYGWLNNMTTMLVNTLDTWQLW